tara:strand:- start:560 stop:1069 length:510 start_codon:yes stop_codon:yes gene_type:complete
MKKNIKFIKRLVINIGLILLILTLEKNVNRIYLKSEITDSFLSHWPFYLVISIFMTLIYWKLESNKIKASFFKFIFIPTFFGLTFFLSNRIELWLNSKTEKEVQTCEYIALLKGFAYGEMGIKNLATAEIDKIKISENKIKGIKENDTIKLEFKKGIFNFRYSPIIREE